MGCVQVLVENGLINKRESSWGPDARHLVEGLAAQDLQVVEEEQELHDDQDGGNDQSGVLDAVLNDVPDQKDRSDQEENGGHERNDLLQLVGSQRQEVQDKDNNVDDHEDKVQAGGEAKTSLTEARTTTDPAGAQDARDDESDNDLGDLDDAAVSGQVAGIDVGHFGWRQESLE